jgi:hypothetical protein
VCGHRTLTPVNRTLQWILAALLGAALCYIALDVAEDGRLDGSLWRAVTAHRSAPAQRP